MLMCVVSILKCHTLLNVELNKIRVCGIQIICYDVDGPTDRRHWHCEEALLCRTIYKGYLE